MELGVAGTLGVAHLSSTGHIGAEINEWLEANADSEVIEIKYSSGDRYSEVLIVYRKY